MTIRSLTCMGLFFICASSTALLASDFDRSFAEIAAPELAAKASDVVNGAPLNERFKVTQEAVTAVIRLRPTHAVSVVSSISKTTPEQASNAAATAAKEQPNQVAAIVKAACAAAPNEVKSIVTAVCKELPNQAKLIAVAAAQAAPGKEKEILDAVGVALPSLKPGIDKALAQLNGASFTMTSILLSAERLQSTAPISAVSTPGSAPIVRAAPVIGPPFTPGGGSPGETTTTNTAPIGPGDGRDYSAP